MKAKLLLWSYLLLFNLSVLYKSGSYEADKLVTLPVVVYLGLMGNRTKIDL